METLAEVFIIGWPSWSRRIHFQDGSLHGCWQLNSLQCGPFHRAVRVNSCCGGWLHLEGVTGVGGENKKKRGKERREQGGRISCQSVLSCQPAPLCVSANVVCVFPCFLMHSFFFLHMESANPTWVLCPGPCMPIIRALPISVSS